MAATSARPNSVAWMFEKKGYIVVEKSKADEEELLAAAIDAGADDMRDDDDELGSGLAARDLHAGARSA